jgi:predicted DNA-binding protein with PD1-like motif
MQTLKAGDVIVVTLAPGEEIMASLLETAAAHKITGGTLTGLGSTSEVEVSFFDPVKKEYLPRLFKEPMEIGSLVGNFSRIDGEPHVHAHITVSGPELIAFTGHLKRGVVGTGCEIYVRTIKSVIERVKDAESGFSPLKLT